MPIENVYSLRDLADVAGVTPRTVRYYIAQGLLPAPEGAGSAARYGEGHLARLRLIGRHQRQHLPLAEIRARLSGLDDPSVIAAIGEPESRRVSESALDYIHALVGDQPADEPADRSARAPALAAPMLFSTPQALSSEPFSPMAPAPMAPAPAPAAPVKPTLERSQWDRVELAPDVELHVRRPLGRLQNKRVERLIAIARQLLEEDPS
jgi:DNA-binding transcriptional MerR regulator